MSVWRELGIAATENVREIKRAYAVRLKKVRPDEHPEEFQRLHEAYQRALVIANNKTAQKQNASSPAQLADNPDEQRVIRGSDDAETASEQAAQFDTIAADSLQEKAQPVQARQEGPSEYDIEATQLFEKLELVITDDSRRYRLENWRFFEKSPYLFDANFSWQVGLFVFRRIETHYRTSTKVYINSGKRCPILDYLNELFGWRLHEHELRRALGDSLCNVLLPLISDDDSGVAANRSIEWLRGSKSIKRVAKYRKEQIRKYFLPSFMKRALAKIIDLILLFAAAVSLRNFAHVEFHFVSTYICIFIGLFFLIAWLFETSRLQATPGMFVLGLKVTDRNFERLNYSRGLLINTAFAIISVGVIFGGVLIQPIIAPWYESIKALGFYVIGGILLILKGYDWSDTWKRVIIWHVIDYRRSEEESRRKAN